MPRSASVVEKADATVSAVGEPPTRSNLAQEDLLARLEVAQQGRLVHADRVGDVGKGDLPDTSLGAERACRSQDGVFTLLFGRWTAGPLKIRGIHRLILAQHCCAINATVFY
jgi:hypothetical protein